MTDHPYVEYLKDELQKLRDHAELMEAQNNARLAAIELTMVELRHKAEELYAWQPVPDGTFPVATATGEMLVEVLHGGHQLVIKERGVNLLLAENMRLCRKAD